MSEIQIYAAVAVATAGVCWYLNRRNQSRGVLATASSAAGLLWPILAVGLVQLGLFIAVKRLVRGRRTSPEVTAVDDDAVPTPARMPEASVAAFQAGPTRATRAPRTADCRADYAAALPRGRAVLVK